MLKTTILLEKLIFERLRVGDDEVNGFSIGRNGVEHIKKSGKLSKSRKLKEKKYLSLEIWLS